MPLRIDSAGERFGTVLATRRVGGFLLRRSIYRPDLATPTHQHDAPYLSFLIQGSQCEHGSRGERVYQAGSLHYHPSGDPHAVVIGPRGMTALSFGPSGRVGLRLEAAPPRPSDLEDPWLVGLARRCNRELGATDSASDLALEGLCLELVASCMRRRALDSGGSPRWLATARDYLHAHLDARVTLAELALVAGVHEAHLARMFRRHLGSSPGGYQRKLRVERARLALEGSGDSLVQIALAAGFSSQSHFTRLFRRQFGVPPGVYRRQIGRRP
jgi:AraC family transcriptional regulator